MIPRLVAITAMLLGIAVRSYGQTDSLEVFFKVAGPHYERFNVYYQGHLLLATPKEKLFIGTLKIPTSSGWKDGSRVDLYITKRILFGIFEKYVGLAIKYDDKNKYLIIFRDSGRKNNYPLVYYWSGVKPKLIE